jgi:osmoprotectant transport system permease protein
MAPPATSRSARFSRTADASHEAMSANVLRLTTLATLLAFLLFPQRFASVFAPLNPYGAPAIYDQGNLLWLAVCHAGTVVIATIASTCVAVGLALLVTRRAGAPFLPLSRALVNVGQTFPPVAVLAVAVPLVGFGLWPTLIALFAYGLLPIFENTLAGIESCPRTVLDAADGMGMSPAQRLRQVELPLALPLIAEGVRITLVINVGTATIGSTVAATGLGEVIIAGLLSNNAAFVLQGGLATALMAVLLYDVMRVLERRVLRTPAISRP